MKPAARIGDPHVCPLSDGPKPHAGGPVAAGAPTVLIGGSPAARVGDPAVCVSSHDLIAQGAATVLVEGRPPARMGDTTVHGGAIMSGCPTVLIGAGPGRGTTPEQCMRAARELAAPFTSLGT